MGSLESGPSKAPKKSKITLMVAKQAPVATTEVVSGRRDQVLQRTDVPATRVNVNEEAALQGQDLPHVGVGFADPDGDGQLGLNGDLEDDGAAGGGWETEEEEDNHLARIVKAKRYYAKVNGYRSRQERNASLQKAWDDVLPSLTDTYLAWKTRAAADTPLDVLDPAASSSLFTIEVIDIYDKRRMFTFARNNINEDAVLTMMRYGFVASTPTAPAFAVGMKTLELYRQLRLHHPRLGFQPFARALAVLNGIPYRTELRRQLSDSFDVYLAIRREVCKRVDSKLGRDTPEWRVQYACPPCGYKLEAEPPLAVARLWCMDGNGSLKRHAAAGGADTRIFKSDYFLEDADEYKDEVRNQKAAKKSSKFVVGAEPGDGDDAADPPPCIDNWKNMQPEHMKHQLEFFEQTGVFIGACRHGFILFIIEMIRSGELAKYPLALVAKMLKVFDEIQRAGYDIGCGFRATLANSKKLKDLVRAAGFDTLTNAFHGHAHHRLCQLRNHPMVTRGVGLEDFETCERVFSASNEVARTIRFATRFHYRQYIDMHYRFWDEQKYAELSKFISDNYAQALDTIKQGNEAMRIAATLNFGAADFVKWRTEEIAYLEGLKKEPEGDVLRIGYVEALFRLAHVKQIADTASLAFNSLVYTGSTPAQYAAYTSRLIQLERHKRDADRDLDAAEKAVRAYEDKLQIAPLHRWTPGMREWQDTLVYIYQRDFRRSLDKLERLVVQRLFELTKANMSGTSYKLRQQIAKALQRRSRAIQTALKNFNAAYKRLDPNAPTLTWKTIAQWTELSDFSLLRMARRDVRPEPWANVTNRDFMVAYFKKLRAEEEITRCNVEARRLRTWIDDEDEQLARAAQEAEAAQDPLAVELRELQRRREHVNHVHRVRLRLLELKEGFSGTPGPGTRLGATPRAPAPTPVPAPPPTPAPPLNNPIELTDDDAEGSDDEEYLDQAERLEEWEVAAAGDMGVASSFFS